jgi:hypothetical protein
MKNESIQQGAININEGILNCYFMFLVDTCLISIF